MRYVSTRGTAPVLDFGEALLAGLADDGVDALGQSRDELPGAGTLERCDHFRIAEFFAERDVAAHGLVQKEHVLGHVADMAL